MESQKFLELYITNDGKEGIIECIL
jgi:hypothetical protein